MGGAASRTQAAAPAPAAGRSGSIVGPNPQLDAETQEMIRETQRRGSGQQRKASWGLFTGGERRKSKEVVLSAEAELQTESYAEAMRLIKQQQEELARLRNENRKVQAELAAAKELLGDRDLARMDGREKAATRDLRGSAGYIAPPKTQPSGSKASTTTKSRRESARRKVIRNFADDLALSRPEAVPKGDGVRDLIWNVCKENLLFSDLDDSCRDRLTDPFAPIECGAGEVVVRQGENGEHFYVVESGHLRVFVKGEEEEEESKAPEASSKEPWDLAMYESHDALGKYVLSVGACGGFGELALMYDTPRAATVIACGDCKLWAIKRSDCKSVLQSIQRAEMKGRVRFLRRVRIGAATGSDEPLGLGEFLTDQELARLASVLESEVVGEGEIIIRQGEPGNHFYIVEEGRVDVHRNEPSSGRRSSVILKENKLKHIETGGYFGERALINEEPRAASVVAAARSRLLTLSREDFVKHLGALADLVAAAHIIRAEEGQTRRRMLGNARHDRRLSARAIQIEDDAGPDPDEMRLEDLTVLGTLGRGSFGIVRLVRHADTGATFACKCQAKAKIVDEAMEAYVTIECKILAMCDNPFVLKLYSTMQTDRCVYLVLELMPGGELYKHLQQMVCFPEPMLRFFVSQIVFAFDCLHGKDVLYRDLKPENLVLDATGYIKVVDFGLSKVLSGWKTWTMCGTPEYLAPEILRNEGHNHGVDFWMLGVLTFELAHGQGPFVAQDEMALFELILKMRPKFPRAFSKNLRDLISRLLCHQKKRLGNSKEGWGAVRRQLWFTGYDWDGVWAKQVTAPLKPSVVVPEPNPDEDDFTLDLTEKEDDAARPDWCPRLPKTMHKWRPTKADDAVNELAAGSPKASPLGSGRRVAAAPYGSPGRGSLGSRRLGAGSPASSPSSPASPAARSLRD